MARALCACCERLEQLGKLPPEAVLWWEEHKRQDQERLDYAQEQRKKQELLEQARAKLTKEEKIALGLG